jgi:diadenosine tetraphosphate (Ap4A) HIT family hydrolase
MSTLASYTHVEDSWLIIMDGYPRKAGHFIMSET